MKGSMTLTERLNGPGHETGLRVFMAIVLWKPEGLAGIGRSLADRVRL